MLLLVGLVAVVFDRGSIYYFIDFLFSSLGSGIAMGFFLLTDTNDYEQLLIGDVNNNN